MIVTYSQKEVEKLLETQRENCYVAIYSHTKNKEILDSCISAPEPGNWKKEQTNIVLKVTENERRI